MSSSNHWYDQNAVSCHETVGKNGKTRRTTIRDARENGWFPSVTTVLGILSKPQLDDWKFKQITVAAWNLMPKFADPNLVNQWHDAVMDSAFQQVDDAADLGTAIHKAIEDHFQGRRSDPAMEPYLAGVKKWIAENGVTFQKHELRLASKSHGYAGTTDAVISCPKGVGILDFKSRKSKPEYPMTAYEDQVLQIAAYDVANFGALPGPERIGVNVFISTTEPGRVEATWYDQKQLVAGWDAFQNALNLWKYLKGYYPQCQQPSAKTA